MITKYDKYNESFNFNREFLKYLFNAYNKALKHFLALHENIKEDHVLEFINHYITNNYGINFLYTVDMLNIYYTKNSKI